MPDLPAGLWFVDIEKMHQGEYWTNRYVVQAPDLATAHESGLAIANYEKLIHYNSVLYVKFRTSDGKKDTDVYAVSNLNFFGGRNLPTDMLTLFNVVRVDFNTAGGGRPSRKYLRGCLAEGDASFNAIIPGIIDFINTSFATPMAGFVPFVDVDGQEIVAGSCYPFVGMRQLRRGSKRKAVTPNTPV